MKIAVASLGDPGFIGTWSGIPASIMAALRKRGHDMVAIKLKKPGEPWFYAWFRRYYHRVQNKWFLASVEEQWLKKISRQLDDEVNVIHPDIVLVIHADWLAYATFDCPACIVHDTTFASIVNYYPSFANLSARSLRMGNQMYKRALQKSVAAIYPARWATTSAVNWYGYPEGQVFTIPFGANMSNPPSREDVYKWIEDRCKSESCNLVFVGTHWERKGGPEIFRFLKELKRLGIACTLTVVGCSPEIPHDLLGVVKTVGFLKKDHPDDMRLMHSIFIRSHALILLSQAECYGCVYCEANAYGLPALGRDTGGVSEIIRDGVNGLLLQDEESIESYAQRWAGIWGVEFSFRELSKNSYLESEQRLNYSVFAEKLEDVLSTVVTEGNLKSNQR